MRPDVLGFLTRRPQTKRELADRMGVSTREVELLVQEARLDGAPIEGCGLRHAPCAASASTEMRETVTVDAAGDHRCGGGGTR